MFEGGVAGQDLRERLIHHTGSYMALVFSLLCSPTILIKSSVVLATTLLSAIGHDVQEERRVPMWHFGMGGRPSIKHRVPTSDTHYLGACVCPCACACACASAHVCLRTSGVVEPLSRLGTQGVPPPPPRASWHGTLNLFPLTDTHTRASLLQSWAGAPRSSPWTPMVGRPLNAWTTSSSWCRTAKESSTSRVRRLATCVTHARE